MDASNRLDDINARLQALDWMKEVMLQEEWRLIHERNEIVKREERQRQRQLKQAQRFLGEGAREVA
jgi:hypothetical protein